MFPSLADKYHIQERIVYSRFYKLIELKDVCSDSCQIK